MLKYNDSHRNHAKNLLFQCRSNKNFYKSKAHSSVMKYESIISGILNQGIQEGVFSSDINMKFIMYMIFGTVDLESLNNMFGNGTDESVNDLNSIMSLLFSVLEKKQKPAHTDRKQAILEAAEKIFAEEGFANAKTAAIAKMAGVAESAIYDYFTGKKELLFAISDRHMNLYVDRISSIFNNQRYDFAHSPVKKLWAVMSSFCLTFLAHKDFMKIYFMSSFFNSLYIENYSAGSLPTLEKFNNLFDNIINEGKSEGIFRADVDPCTFRFMLMGSYAHLVLRWIIREHRKFDKYSETHDLLILLLTAVLDGPSDLDYLINIEL